MKQEEVLDELSFYSEEMREELIESDGLTPEEAAFMQGYDEAEDPIK